ECGPYVRVQVLLADLLTAPRSFAGMPLGHDIEAGPDEAQRVSVVTPKRGDGTDQGRNGVQRHTKPLCPRPPLARVVQKGLSDVEHHSANHAGHPTLGIRS